MPDCTLNNANLILINTGIEIYFISSMLKIFIKILKESATAPNNLNILCITKMNSFEKMNSSYGNKLVKGCKAKLELV